MAKRAVAQSAAREFGPRGIHVAHAVIDGVVDNPNTKQFFSEKVSPRIWKGKSFSERLCARIHAGSHIWAFVIEATHTELVVKFNRAGL